MLKKLLILTLISLLASCASPATYRSYNGIKHAPTKKVEVFSEAMPIREYSEIGIIYVKGRVPEFENLIKKAAKKAREVGAGQYFTAREYMKKAEDLGVEISPNFKKDLIHKLGKR